MEKVRRTWHLWALLIVTVLHELNVRVPVEYALILRGILVYCALAGGILITALEALYIATPAVWERRETMSVSILPNLSEWVPAKTSIKKFLLQLWAIIGLLIFLLYFVPWSIMSTLSRLPL